MEKAEGAILHNLPFEAFMSNWKFLALHRARREMMETDGKKHPFYWAPFVLIGDFR